MICKVDQDCVYGPDGDNDDMLDSRCGKLVRPPEATAPGPQGGVRNLCNPTVTVVGSLPRPPKPDSRSTWADVPLGGMTDDSANSTAVPGTFGEASDVPSAHEVAPGHGDEFDARHKAAEYIQARKE